jgi:rhodanese-related sulfurtransferase
MPRLQFSRKFLLLPPLLLALCGCSATITAADLQRRMAATPPPLIVDVRSRDEYARDHIPGAVHIPFSSIGSGLQERGYPREGTVVLYCEHGPRAGLAGISLYFHGYTDVHSLEGHMQGWRQSGRGVETGDRH